MSLSHASVCYLLEELPWEKSGWRNHLSENTYENSHILCESSVHWYLAGYVGSEGGRVHDSEKERNNFHPFLWWDSSTQEGYILSWATSFCSNSNFSPHCWSLLLLLLLLISHFSRVRLCATPEMAAHQAPPSLGFSRQEHWSGLPFPSPMHESEKWKWSHSVVSDSLRPHGRQPTRPLRPLDFPGKSTGVGCH